jgi:anti-anti-sigma factor
MANLTIDLQEIKDVANAAHVTMEGSVDKITVGKFFTALDNARTKGAKNFFIDLGKTRYIGSAAIAYLINLAQNLRQEQGDVFLLDVHPRVKIVLELLGLASYFKFFTSLEEALPKPQSGSKTASSPESTVSLPVPEVLKELAQQKEIVECKSCRTRFGVKTPGKYKCPKCQTIFIYTKEGGIISQREVAQVLLGPSTASIEGLKSFINAFIENFEFGLQKEYLGEIIQDTINTIINLAYDGDNNSNFKVIIVASNSALEIRFIDNGKPINHQDCKQLILKAKKVFDKFEIRHNEKIGNTILIVKEK